VRTDVWSNKNEKGYNSRKNQPSVKSVQYAHVQIMANQDTKYEWNATKDKWLVAYTRYVNGHMVKQTWKGLELSQKSTICEIGIICTCSDHGQPRYQIWIKCDKRQMTSCVHKMYERTYGQTNMKRAIALAKINHPWNRYNMRMLRSWQTKIPNMNKIQQKTND
jgi:hypothetical protein